ncbi:MAG TPA: cytochrome b [Hyphomicrobiaceae bacterium]|nr:cytochrome b [Hyphomicrobiaceae bacterium]
MLKDTLDSYGAVTRWFHWLMALAVFALFGLGLWMVDLTYYDTWYNAAPDLHKSAGMVFLAALVLRLIWRFINPKPVPEVESALERKMATFVHVSFYLLLIALCVSGYLIATAKGQPLNVFGIVRIPAIWTHDGLETPAGMVHRWLAWTTIVLALVHAAAAIKHHLWDGKRTLVRMLRG